MLLAESLLGSSSTAATYIEDVFSTYLYTGNGSTQTITNGIDLSTKGGLVWIKNRAIDKHCLYDTARGALKVLSSNATNAEQVAISGRDLTGFTASGFSLGPNYTAAVNENTANHASWTFRKQAKFFDVVTYTGNGVARTIAHNLGSVPGCIIVKKTSGSSNWAVYHRSLTSAAYTVLLNTTDAQMSDSAVWNSTAPTSTVFSVGGSAGGTNDSGETYVAYLFAHNAGGFGASGSDNVISCGSWTGTGSPVTVNLGWEPQLLLWKKSSAIGSWYIADNMRLMTASDNGQGRVNILSPNTSDAESADNYLLGSTSTGFVTDGESGTHIYIAIRRGPMKTPTTGTSVFSPIASSAATGTTLTTSFPVDAQIFSLRTGTTNKNNTYDRLRGVSSTTTESGARLITSSTAAETAAGNETRLWDNTSFQMPSTFGGASTVFWNFRRAPGFFDVVCYTGTGANRTVSHNLGVAPELMIVKARDQVLGWPVWNSTIYAANADNIMYLNETGGQQDVATMWNSSAPTSTTFPVGTNSRTNASTKTFVAYLFASVAGVSKVGSYTGTGTTKQIDCGFTGGARFVLIKRTDSTGDWYVWDTARGIVAGNDPYLLLNSTAAEVTNTDYIDTYSAGFEISSTAPAAINANGGSFIFLAIA